MKTPLDPRHQKRRKAVEDLFKSQFLKQPIGEIAQKIMRQQDFIDQKINEIAPDFPIDKVNKIDLAILRLSIFELLIDKTQPPRVIIDEAVELAKEYGGETSPKFINGALGKLIKQ